jgi:DNA-binding NarL/FixJ family response regulator
MLKDPRRRDNRLVVIANDDPSTRSQQASAFEAAGLPVIATAIDAAARLIAAGGPAAIVISLTSAAGLRLLQDLAGQPRLADIPVIVSACASEPLRARAEQIGTVAIFMDRPAPEVLVAAVVTVIGPSDEAGHQEFPAACPQCLARSGMPRSVSTAAAAVTYIGLKCDSCGQNWRVRRADAASA